MRTKNVVFGIIAALGCFAGETANASMYPVSPGSACFFYSGAESGDVMSRSGGNGMLHNNDSVEHKVECPFQWNLDDTAGGSQSSPAFWFMHLGGTGWVLSKCNLYGAAANVGYAFPTSRNRLTNPGSGITDIGGSSSTMVDLGLANEIICAVPAGGTVMQYGAASL
jgi:hypothetical protein